MLEKWTQLWLSLRAPLAHLPIVGDLGPYAALTLAVWAVVWAVRRYRPSWWARLLRLGIDPEGALSHFIQAVPGAIIGGLWAGGTTLDVEQAAYGLLFGLFAAPLHHLVKLSPAAYQGALRDRANLYAKAMKGIGLSLVLLTCTGCTKADMLKVVNTADDAAKVACALFFSEHQGISVHDAAKLFCDTREAIDVFLASQKQAGEEMATAQGLARK